MGQTINKQVVSTRAVCSKWWAEFVCAFLMVCSGAAFAQASEFTDRVRNAKAKDTKELRESAANAANDFGFILGIGGMVVGLFFFIWGIIWVMSASRSEGRKEAKGGWIMMVGGAALGTAAGLYVAIVGVFSSAGT